MSTLDILTITKIKPAIPNVNLVPGVIFMVNDKFAAVLGK